MDTGDIGRVARILKSGETKGMREGALGGLAFVVGSAVFLTTESWIWAVIVTVPFLAVLLLATRPKPVMSLSLAEQQHDAEENSQTPG